MFCPKCGYNYGDESSNFCPKCGAPLNNQLAEPEEEEDTFIKKPFRDEYGNRISDPNWHIPKFDPADSNKFRNIMVVIGVFFGIIIIYSLVSPLADEYSPGMTYSQKVEYIETTVDQLYDDLDANSMRAKETWDGQYIRVVGRLSSIDSDGDYLTITSADSFFSFDDLQCSIPDTLQDQVKKMNVDDIVQVQAQIDMVGDILGYHADLIWIQAAE